MANEKDPQSDVPISWHNSQDVTGEIEDVLREWRTKALSTILKVATVVGFLALLSPLAAAIREPEIWPRTLVYLVIYLFLVGLAVQRCLDFRLAGWGAILMGYAAGVVALTRVGLAGSGRIFIIMMPVLAIVLIGVRSGVIAAALSLAIMLVFTVLAHLGLLERWLVYLVNPLNLDYWIESTVDLAMLLTLAVVLLERFHRLQVRTMEAEHRASAELARANAELELRVERRTADLSQANAQLTMEIAERKLMEEAFGESQRRLEESYQREQGRRQLADTLREVAKILTGTLEHQRVLDLILEQLENVTTYHRATVMLLTDDKRNLRVVAGHDKMGGEFEHVTVPVDRYPMNAAVLAEKQPLLIPNVVDDDRWQPTETMSSVHSFINAPLLAQDQPIGLLAVGRRDDVPYTEDDAQTVFAFATQAAVALENARLYAETKRRVAELATLTDVGQALSSTLRVDEVFQLIYAQTRRVMYAKNMIIMLHDQAGHEIECAFSNNPDDVAPGVRFPADTGLTGYIIKHRRSVLLRDSVDEGIRELGLEMAGQPSASWLGVPMMMGERVLGVIIVQHYTTPNVYDESHQVLLETIASQAAIAIENARLFEEVQREKQYSESLVVNSPAAIVVVDTDHNVTSWNPAAEKLFGYSQAEALGRRTDDLVATEAIRAQALAYTRQAARGEVVRAITQRSRRDGTMVDVELLAVPLIVEDEQVGTLAIYHDITELQRARQEAEAANRAKSAFLATMSHEIRTPMNGVIGMTSLLLDTDLTPEQHEFTETIRQSGDALLTIINDVLDFSKIEAGRMDLESQPFDLRQCVESALDLVATKAAEKGLEMIYTVDDQVPAAVVGDATRLRQILVNLLNNAVKFTEQGEVVVQVVSEQVADTTQYELHFSVRDTGIGIPQDRMDRLFQSFSQVDASMTRRYGGIGLGLVISKRLSEMMGGTMWVESPSPPLSSPPLAGGTEGGPGSTFHFTIRAEAAPVPMPTYLRGAQPDLRGRRMLIVDDNDTNRRILMLQAQSWGMLPRDTALPAEALDWVHRGDPFDVAVLDVQMPEMDGMTLAEKIRQEHDTRALPIILLSSLGLREADAAEGEFIPCLTKPVKASQLYNVLVGIFVAQEQTAKRDDVTAKAQFDPEMGQRLPLRILLAEDNAVNQKLALRLLERMGYRADLAANGLEALEALRRQSYDVVLMDVQMPEMDGLEATRIICQEWTQERRPRLIAMTANVMQEDREAYLAAGMDDYVGKPIQVGELVNALNKCRPLVETRCSEMAEREGTEA